MASPSATISPAPDSATVAAPLLGVRGVCIIGHGSSNDRAIFNGIRVAYESAKAGTIQRIEAEFAIPGRASHAVSPSASQAVPGDQSASPDATIQ